MYFYPKNKNGEAEAGVGFPSEASGTRKSQALLEKLGQLTAVFPCPLRSGSQDFE